MRSNDFVKTVDADFRIINGENLAGGIGITPSVAVEMLSYGVDVITTGNHVWKKKRYRTFPHGGTEGYPALELPPGTPGFGYTI